MPNALKVGLPVPNASSPARVRLEGPGGDRWPTTKPECASVGDRRSTATRNHARRRESQQQDEGDEQRGQRKVASLLMSIVLFLRSSSCVEIPYEKPT